MFIILLWYFFCKEEFPTKKPNKSIFEKEIKYGTRSSSINNFISWIILLQQESNKTREIRSLTFAKNVFVTLLLYILNNIFFFISIYY